ncbi:hypothetical protein V6N11_076373 [Hibiscus sabdariffa]|uniref:TPX2 C-terminal domain-containing protein n=1 Tax=Hibiscus sabdariffa TaxID=183260 RepID=A0ABR2Q622_9ROSI
MEKPLLKSGKTTEESEVTSKKKPSYSSSKVSAEEYNKELELSEGTQMEKPLLKNGKTNQIEIEVTSKWRPSHNSSKVSANARTSKVPSSPAKFKAPPRLNDGNKLTPMAKKPAIDMSERKRLTRLEEKFDVFHEQKVQQQITLKEKAGTELKKLQQSFCFKARPLPDFYKERIIPKDQIQKVPLTKLESPSIGRKSTPSKASIVESKNSLPHRKSSIKNTCFLRAPEKKDRISVRSLASQTVMTAHENTSPNIQHA